MTGSLDIHLGEAPAGRLDADDSGQMTFAYRSADPAITLSMSLPPRAEPYGDSECRPFFAGLLPEGTALERAAAARRIQVYETFKLLAAFGGDCAGAVRLLPPGTAPHIKRDYELVEGEALARMIAEVGSNPNFARDRRVRLSVAGAQTKTAVRLADGKIFVPLGGSPTTHIVKVGSDDYPDLPKNEAFCMRLAAKCGLRVPEIGLREVSGHHYCVVTRYDRIVSNDSVGEIHQEDFCQALGYLPARKYEVDEQTGDKTGPGVRDCFDLLRRTRRPGPDLLQFLNAILFNYLIGNADAHAKNFSLLYDGQTGNPGLAPFYDFVCTRIYPQISEHFAMRHGAALNPGDMSRQAWETFAAEAAIDFRLLRNVARRLASIVVDEARGLTASEFRSLPPMAHIVNSIGERVDRLSRDLELGIEVDTPPFDPQPPGWGGFLT